ncbi:MAG TPA: NADH-quinone oxidoreductase subunit M, partial [Fimbriimonas sp.]|nr:NADH-quinone oxidoreductase subunit M [Fimbriimonas sp.]
MPLLSIQIWLPLVGAVLLLAASKAPAALARGIAWVTALLTFLVSVGIYLGFQQDSFHFQLVESHDWIPSLGIKYALGIDGISLWLVVLTSFIGLIAVGLSRYVTQQTHAFLALVLALESFMLGAFASLDLLLFFTFFELTLFPLYFLIVIWGGERRNFAGAKFFIYTFAGSIFMLIGMIAVAFRMPGGASFDLQQIQQVVSTGQLWQGNTTLETLVFWAFTVGFLIKSPSFPFHTWIADTYSESPAVVPLLSSVMAKLGTFGLLRFCLPLFPDVVAAQTPLLMGLAIAGIVYGGILATIQKDMRRVIAYSSVSHMGFILLGIFSLMYSGMVGAAYQQINHGIVAGGLIVLIGLLYERRKTNQLSEYGGLKAQMPMFATLFLILTLASVGLPGTNGFVGEFLSLLGSFEVSSHKLVPGLSLLYPVIAVSGVVLAAGYML